MRLLLVGGGHAHVGVIDALSRHPQPEVEITLLSRDLETAYSGMLPGQVAGLYTRAESHIDIARFASARGVRFLQGEVDGLDREARVVLGGGRILAGYDVLSLDIGSVPVLDTPGAAEHALCVRPYDAFLYVWDSILAEARRAGQAPRIAVVGGGIGGVELAMAAQAGLMRATGAAASEVSVVLVTRDGLLPGTTPRGRRLLAAALDRRGIRVVEHAGIQAVEPDALVCAGGRIGFDHALWSTGAGAPPWLAATGLVLDGAGYVAVDARLRSLNDPRVFAAGDVAGVLPHPRPKAGVYAVRQGAPLAANLRRALKGEALRPFRPQRRALALVGTGDRHAVAIWGPLAAEGAWAWRLKEWIDRRWIARYQT